MAPELRADNTDHTSREITSRFASFLGFGGEDHHRARLKSSKDRQQGGKPDPRQSNELKEVDSYKRLQKASEEKDSQIGLLNADLKGKEEIVGKLTNENQRLEADNRSLANELAQNQEQFSIMKSFHESASKLADGRIRTQERTIADLQNTNRLLQDDYNKVSGQLQKIQNDFSSFQHNSMEEINQLRGFIKSEQQKSAAIEKNNSDLRRLIGRMSKVQEPLRGEDHYVKLFDDLKNDIDSWVASHSKKNANATLRPQVPKTILAKLDALGEHGKYTAEFLRLPNLLQLHSGKKTRIPLIRHVLALFLFDQIFEPFAFGLTRDSSQNMKDIEDQLFKQGTSLLSTTLNLGHDYNKLVMIRQAIAKSVLDSCKKDVLAKQTACVTDLTDLLCGLLPVSKPKDIESGVSKFIDRAVKLKYDMAEEQAVYRCFLVDNGQPIDEKFLSVPDEGYIGCVVFLCTFPGLQRIVIHEGKAVRLTVVRAAVELQAETSGNPKKDPAEK